MPLLKFTILNHYPKLKDQDNASVLLIFLQYVDEALGASVFFKCENFQRMGAFKFRGAFNALSKFDAGQRRRGVVAFSSGNHAQAVALSAQLLGMPATIVMPNDAPRSVSITRVDPASRSLATMFFVSTGARN